MASQADFSRTIKLIEIERLSAGPQRIDLLLALQARHALGMVVADLLDALRLRELDQRFTLAPGKGGAVLDSIFFVELRVLRGCLETVTA